MLKPGINTSICIHFIGGERASVNEVSLNTKFQKQYFSTQQLILFPAGAPLKRNLPSLGPGEENSLAKNLDTLLLNAETDVSPQQPEIKPKPRGRKPKPKLAELVEDKEEDILVVQTAAAHATSGMQAR